MDFPVVDGVSFGLVADLTGYAVGDNGSVWSLHSKCGRFDDWHRVAIYRRPYGARYCVVSLRLDDGKGKVTYRYVHRLVLEAFVGPAPSGMLACHGDGNTANNVLSNLRWDTPSANSADMLRHGTRPQGSGHKCSKLTDNEVREIRRLWNAGGVRQCDLAAKFGVHQVTVSGLVRRKRWKHLV